MAGRPPGAPAPASRSRGMSEAPASKSPPVEALGEVSGERRLFVLPPDWLPVALLVGDGIIAAFSVPAGYWIKYASAPQSLPFGPYLAAIPVVVILYIFSMAVMGQYR